MLRSPVLLFLLAVLLVLAAPRARAQEEVSFDYFYDNLKPYGDWVQVADYGLCWHPRDVPEDWSPYSDGYWAYTDAGWTWVSYEEFGDIVYHYGRWVRVEDEGWCWVPDNDWGPAWVSWRNNDDYVGWAPLPPEAHFRPEVGISVWADETYDIGPGYYQFCRTRDFGAPVIREVCLPRSRNIAFFRETVNITNITIVTGYGIPFCGGPRYDFISTRVARPIPALRLVRETNITNININVGGSRRSAFASVQRGNSLLMPAPRIRAIADRNAPVPNVNPTRVLPANRVSRGWGEVKSPQEREDLRAVMKQQTKGATPDTAPARHFAQADVKAVPQKSDLNAPPVTGVRTPVGRGPAAASDPGDLRGRQPVVVATPGKGKPTVATDPGEEPRGRQPVVIATPSKGKSGKSPAVVAPVVPTNPQRTVETPGSRVPQAPDGNPVTPGGFHNQHTPMVVTPGASNQVARPEDGVRTTPVVPQRIVPNANPSTQSSRGGEGTRPDDGMRNPPVVPQRVVPGGNPSTQPSRGGGDVVTPKSGFKGDASNPSVISPGTRDANADAARAQRMQADAQREQAQRAQENALRQQNQQAAAAAQERAAAAAESRQRAAAAADARQRSMQQQQQQAVARQRDVQTPVVPQRGPQAVPQRPPVSGTPVQDPRSKGKGKDKDDDKR